MRTSRRKFVQGAATAAAASKLAAQQPGSVRGFDHVALPMQNTDAMLAFYRGLGFPITETANACSVYIGDQMINFHRPALWQSGTFTLRAPPAIAVAMGPFRPTPLRRTDSTAVSLRTWPASAEPVEPVARASISSQSI